MPQNKAFSDRQDLVIVMVSNGGYFIETLSNLDQSLSGAEYFAVTVSSALLLMGCPVLSMKKVDAM